MQGMPRDFVIEPVAEEDLHAAFSWVLPDEVGQVCTISKDGPLLWLMWRDPS